MEILQPLHHPDNIKPLPVGIFGKGKGYGSEGIHSIVRGIKKGDGLLLGQKVGNLQ